jgi:hypothetical protein
MINILKHDFPDIINVPKNLKDENLTAKQIVGYFISTDNPMYIYESETFYDPKELLSNVDSEEYYKSNPINPFRFTYNYNELEILENMRNQYYHTGHNVYPLVLYLDFIYQYFKKYPKNLFLKDFLIDELKFKHKSESELLDCCSLINLKYDELFY